MKNTKNIYL